MKKILLVIALGLFIIACHDSKDSAVQKLPKRYDKTVGGQIPFAVAVRWVKNFGGTITTGREQSDYSISAEALSQLLSSNEGPGVVFHHASDENGTYHILLFTLGANGELFQSDIFDLATGQILNSVTAIAWAQNYADEHPATPSHHFFGNGIFFEIQSNPAFEYVSAVRALNEEDEEQVLLFAYNTRNLTGGRTEGEDVVVYDMSSPCPPCSAN